MKMIVLVMTLCSMAHADIKPYRGPVTKENPDYKEIYLSNGSQTSDTGAFTALLQGKEVYRCVLQEVSMSKNGHGAAMRNVKKKQ